MENGRLERTLRNADDRGSRRLGVSIAVVFLISLAFPVVAGLWSDTSAFPRLWGVLDVVVAFILAALAIFLAARFDRRVDDEIRRSAYRGYRALMNVVLVLLVVFLVAGDRVRWTVFLPGIAWRGWLLFYALPAWLAAIRNKQVVSEPGESFLN